MCSLSRKTKLPSRNNDSNTINTNKARAVLLYAKHHHNSRKETDFPFVCQGDVVTATNFHERHQELATAVDVPEEQKEANKSLIDVGGTEFTEGGPFSYTAERQ